MGQGGTLKVAIPRPYDAVFIEHASNIVELRPLLQHDAGQHSRRVDERARRLPEDRPSLRHLPYLELLEVATIHDMPHLVEHVQASLGKDWQFHFGARGRVPR